MGIVKQTDIDQILSTRHGKINKVIISLILSSGMQPKFIRDLTLNQLLDACEHYNEVKDKTTLEDLMQMNIEEQNFIPCFDIGTDNSPRITCCTPEALHLILDYIDRYRPVPFETNDEPILLNQDGTRLTTNYVSDLLRKMNNEVGDGHRQYGFVKVTATGLINRFNDICERYLEGSHAHEVHVLMKGNRSARNRQFYEDVCNDRDILISHYLSVADYLNLMPNYNELQRRQGRLNYTTNLY